METIKNKPLIYQSKHIKSNDRLAMKIFNAIWDICSFEHVEEALKAFELANLEFQSYCEFKKGIK